MALIFVRGILSIILSSVLSSRQVIDLQQNPTLSVHARFANNGYFRETLCLSERKIGSDNPYYFIQIQTIFLFLISFLVQI